MVKEVDLLTAAKYNQVREIGRMRFDTMFLRWQWWFAQVQRTQRMILRDEINYIETPVVTKSKVLSRNITEFAANEKMSKFEESDQQYKSLF